MLKFLCIQLLLLLLLRIVAGAGNLSSHFTTWLRDDDAEHVDIYAPGSLAITWLGQEAGQLVGYFHHLETHSSTPTLLFGLNISRPYALVKWHDGRQAIIDGGSCDGKNMSLMIEGRRQALPFNGCGHFSRMAYDYFTSTLYLYHKPLLYSFSTRGDNFAELLNTYQLEHLDEFYVSNAHIFYTTTMDGEKVRVYNERKHGEFIIETGDAVEGRFRRYYVYDPLKNAAAAAAAYIHAPHHGAFTTIIFTTTTTLALVALAF